MKVSKKSLLLSSIGSLALASVFCLPASAQYVPQNGPGTSNGPGADTRQSASPSDVNPPPTYPQSPGQDPAYRRYGTGRYDGPPPADQQHAARPGAVNYIEGHAAIDGRSLGRDAVGTAELNAGQTLTTNQGKVEVLLTPGVFLRVGDNSAVRMVSPDLANTEIAVEHGRAMVEVADISKDNNIRIDVAGANVKLLKRGLYDFDAARSQVRVFKGKAEIFANNQKAGVGEDHQVTLNDGGKLHVKEFKQELYADDLYRWSGLRSGYLAEAGADAARTYVNGGSGWYGTGWYWDPWFGAYTFIPGAGIFYSPFGWGFYSPFAVFGSPFFYGGYYGGYGRYHNFNELHGPYGHGFEPRGGFHGGFAGGSFHGGGGFHGGGFHGGGRR